MIELRHLRYFVAVAEELNFRRAAGRTHIDQSPLSRAVRGLEEDIGILLFARTPRTLRLASTGERLLANARKLVASIERAVRETDERYRASLRIGIANGISQPKLAHYTLRLGTAWRRTRRLNYTKLWSQTWPTIFSARSWTWAFPAPTAVDSTQHPSECCELAQQDDHPAVHFNGVSDPVRCTTPRRVFPEAP